MLRSREHASFSEAGMLDRKKGLPEVGWLVGLLLGFVLFLGLLFMLFLVGAIVVLRKEKESCSNG